jgi:hypothetical protein
MEKVAIATTQPNGYWALGAKWSTQSQTLEVVPAPSGSLPDDLSQAGIPESVRRFHQRAALISEGKIALEDVERAKEDPRLVVIGKDDLVVVKAEVMTPSKIEAKADELTAGPRKVAR